MFPVSPDNTRRHATGAGVGLLLAALLLASLAFMPAAKAFEPEARVVYHADFADPRRFSAMLTSINNMMTYYQNEFMDVDVRIVFVAHGIRFLTDDDLADTPFAADAELRDERDTLRGRLMSLASTHGVKLELCEITRSQIGLDQEEVYDHVEFVPSGVVRIAELQNEKGFAYLKIE
ncbi:DsrE family protein [Thioalkalivibrio sp. ALJT]|uniref:DsrE family protein n=1 Tax=Thioalkalivibrio sp. ALJT TaxID=1158146 RepID=UPI000365AC59|nr:DsrE family protein [Thioalkalivibrio sp. ALJT]